jgi:hypothetical protein
VKGTACLTKDVERTTGKLVHDQDEDLVWEEEDVFWGLLDGCYGGFWGFAMLSRVWFKDGSGMVLCFVFATPYGQIPGNHDAHTPKCVMGRVDG